MANKYLITINGFTMSSTQTQRNINKYKKTCKCTKIITNKYVVGYHKNLFDNLSDSIKR